MKDVTITFTGKELLGIGAAIAMSAMVLAESRDELIKCLNKGEIRNPKDIVKAIEVIGITREQLVLLEHITGKITDTLSAIEEDGDDCEDEE